MPSDLPPNSEQTTKTNSENLGLFADKFGVGESGKLKPSGNKEGIEDFERRGSEKRKNINNWIASILAIALWAILIYTIYTNLSTTVSFSNYLVASDSPVEVEKVQTAVTLVNDTAKTLYSFLGTLVTAVTAYYFKTVADNNNNNNNS